MPTKLNLLLLEDSSLDAELILAMLGDAGFDVASRCVDSEAAYLRELDQPPDLILSDCSLPKITACQALRLLQERGLDIPLIILSGCIGEETAVECMKAGATDYLMKDRLGRLGHAVSQALDRKRLLEDTRVAERRLELERYHDTVTGLPNRALLMDRLDRVYRQSRRHPSHLFAVLYLNLDSYRMIHDSLSAAAANQLLIDVSHRMLGRVRSADTVARMEGDAFAFLLDNMNAFSNVTHVATRLLQTFTTPFMVEEREVLLSASMGIACCHAGYEGGDQLLRDAATAMQQAKTLGRTGFVFFDPAMHQQAMGRLKLESELRQALEREEFRLEYQPIVSLKSGQVVGFEALLRWEHPEQGLTRPEEFLAVAAELGLMPQIGAWILREACLQLGIWQAEFSQRPPLTMSVNVSLEHYAYTDLASFVTEVLNVTGVTSSSLLIEIAESDMRQNPEAVTEVLRQLTLQHIQTCLDDFGMGYSSFSKELPMATFLKIDQSFVQRLGMDDEAFAIVKALIVLAHQLGRQVIAKGVETEAHLKILRILGCKYAQGYFFAKPLPGADVSSFLTSGRVW